MFLFYLVLSILCQYIIFNELGNVLQKLTCFTFSAPPNEPWADNVVRRPMHEFFSEDLQSMLNYLEKKKQHIYIYLYNFVINSKPNLVN
ncbi:MAG: hypothetical protein A2V65_08885 [Deltaproteobacteria bacterium RBG_13_49_15]|nr:MAG: hypothetical protein A2V65_08885 [Deltaproteobacteria bacterium RBG_13_49_15]